MGGCEEDRFCKWSSLSVRSLRGLRKRVGWGQRDSRRLGVYHRLAGSARPMPSRLSHRTDAGVMLGTLRALTLTQAPPAQMRLESGVPSAAPARTKVKLATKRALCAQVARTLPRPATDALHVPCLLCDRRQERFKTARAIPTARIASRLPLSSQPLSRTAQMRPLAPFASSAWQWPTWLKWLCQMSASPARTRCDEECIHPADSETLTERATQRRGDVLEQRACGLRR